MAKTKAFLSAFLIALMISGLAFVSCVHFSAAQSGTNVTGIINSDTTWTQANSPYTLTGNVLVNNGVTLTIQAGVTVNMDVNSLQVNGTLVAIGTSTNEINFNGGPIAFTSVSNGWNNQNSSGCIIENSIINSGVGLPANMGFSPVIDIQNASPLMNNDTIVGMTSVGNVAIYVNNGSPIISNSIITTGGDAIQLWVAPLQFITIRFIVNFLMEHLVTVYLSIMEMHQRLREI